MHNTIRLILLSFVLLTCAMTASHDVAQAGNGTVIATRNGTTVYLDWSGNVSSYWDICYKKKGSIHRKCRNATKFRIYASGSNQYIGGAYISGLEIGKNYKFVVFDDLDRKVGKTTCKIHNQNGTGC